MPYCVVAGCKNGTGKKNTFTGSMHKFPADERLRNTWVKRINRKDYTWQKYHKICSDHFLDEDYVLSRTRALQIGFIPGEYQLKKGTIPSQKLKDCQPTQTVKPRSSLAVIKRKNLETIQLFQTTQWEPMCIETSPVAEPVSHGNTNAEGTEIQTKECESQSNKYTDAGTQASVQVCNKDVICKPNVKSKSVQCSRKTPSTTRGIQTTKAIMIDKSVSCNLFKCKCDIKVEDTTSDSDSMESSDAEMDDPEYDPEQDMMCSSSDDDNSDSDDEIESDLHDNDTRKFIVYASCLRILLAICSLCSAPCRVLIKIKRGTAVTLESICTSHHRRIWTSQPIHQGMAQGNLSLASSLFFSGSSAVKAINMLKFAQIQTMSIQTFEHIQRCYLIPAITNVWERRQFFLFSKIQEEGQNVSVGGDARCDSPGHCAKYGSYSLMDVNRGLILSTQLVQCNEVGSSAAMEKEGLIRCIEELQENDITVGTLITDRHPSVRKFMKENHTDVKHYFDVWHIAKGIRKKIIAQGQKAGFRLLLEWQASITNHLYWSAVSSHGNGDLVKAKWASILNHVCNIHDGHGPLYSECSHGELGPRSWFRKGSKEYKALSKIVDNVYLMKDVPHMSPKDQTSALEGFHKLVCFFAPKQVHYPYNSMKARCLLAAMHFNENASRNQRRSKNGSLQWRATYPKYRKGDGVIKAVKGPCTYEYVEELMTEAAQLRQLYPSYRAASVNREIPPPTITESLDTTHKEILIERHISRFT